MASGPPSRFQMGKSELSAAMRAALDGGWYEPEDTHMWTMRRAQFSLSIPANATQLCIELASMRPRDGDRPLPLKIAFDADPPETVFLTHPHWQTLRVKLPRQAHGRSIHIALEVERTIVPALLHLNQDMRELGVAVSRIWLE